MNMKLSEKIITGTIVANRDYRGSHGVESYLIIKDYQYNSYKYYIKNTDKKFHCDEKITMGDIKYVKENGHFIRLATKIYG